MNEQQLEIFKEDISSVLSTIKDIAEEILSSEITKYPVFVAYLDEINIGRQIIDKETYGIEWNINASTLEEFAAKNIIMKSRVEPFIKVYKNPVEYICFFIVTAQSGSFVFVPYKNK